MKSENTFIDFQINRELLTANIGKKIHLLGCIGFFLRLGLLDQNLSLPSMIILPASKSGSFNNFVNVFHNAGNNLWSSITFYFKEDFRQRLFIIRNNFLMSLVFDEVDNCTVCIKWSTVSSSIPPVPQAGSYTVSLG